jgi:hypothetical protein
MRRVPRVEILFVDGCANRDPALALVERLPDVLTVPRGPA